jgi:Protein of unknown function (DUF2905)
MTAQPPLEQLGRWLVVAGIALVALGALLTFSKTLRLGSLPGDVHMSGRGWQLWLPLGTSLVLSLLLTLLLNLFFRRR